MTKEEAVNTKKYMSNSDYFMSKVKNIWLTNDQGTDNWKLDVAYKNDSFGILTF